MSFSSILVGDDGNPEAEQAVAVATSLGEKLGAKVILLGVVSSPSAESQAEGYGLTSSSNARKKLQEQLERTAESSIEEVAQRTGADLIVVGHKTAGRLLSIPDLAKFVPAVRSGKSGYAPVEMTKGRAVTFRKGGDSDGQS